MPWRSKIEQLVGMLEKTPQPKKYDSIEGVYQPYFLLELRPTNWEIYPYASYTRLDGSPGREVRLNLSIIDNSKVNIRKEELNCLIYLQSGTNAEAHNIFAYTQPVGFLLDWLSSSKLMVKDSSIREPIPLAVHPAPARIVLRFISRREGFALQPSLILPDGVLDINSPATLLTSNPNYLIYDKVLYRVESSLPAIFWSNFFRIHENFEIPRQEINEFIRLYLPHILPVMDWNNLDPQIQRIRLPLAEKIIQFSEIDSQLLIQVYFRYNKFQFPAMPPSNRSLANEGKKMFIVERELEAEEEACRLLENYGLIYSSGHWHVAVDYQILDWMRLQIPQLRKAGFTIKGEDQLKVHRVIRQKPNLRIQIKSGIDWLDMKYQLTLGNRKISVPRLLRQIESGRSYLRLRDGSQIFLSEELQKEIQQLSNYVDLDDGNGQLRLPFAGIVLLEELNGLSKNVQLDSRTREILRNYREFKSIVPADVPRQFKGVLRAYQKSGLDWLHFLHQFNFGGILADDIGLGKTVQVIALLCKIKETQPSAHPALIIVPLTLIFNWMAEFQKFAPHLKVLAYQGNRNDRMRKLQTFGKYDIVLCSYGVALQDKKYLEKSDFYYLILDESQKIKNPHTKTYQAIRKFKAPHKLAITGTPVENSLLDLWAQFNFINPGLLGSLNEFQEKYMNAPEDDKEERIRTLQQRIFPFILRRAKSEVEKQLPPLTEVVQRIKMTEFQSKVYHRWLRRYRNEVFARVEQDGLNKARLLIVEALTYLRQITCHPLLVKEEAELLDSGKLLLLKDMLGDIFGEGHKVLIFSQFVRFLKLVRQLFEEEGWQYEYLDGKVRKREKRINNFQNNPKISAFLISLKAGGLGLNLTSADYVIHLDPWWNPAVEQQATDRAHRIGQTRKVFVYKYIVTDSVEDKILRLQQQKKELSQELITTDSALLKNLSRRDLEQLFEFTAID